MDFSSYPSGTEVFIPIRYPYTDPELFLIGEAPLTSPSLSSSYSATAYSPPALQNSGSPIKCEARVYSEEISEDGDSTQCCQETPLKRPRGRPRKTPDPNAEPPEKVPKVRSKTGCLTCRKRKKKCDETKPVCVLCLCSVPAYTTNMRSYRSQVPEEQRNL